MKKLFLQILLVAVVASAAWAAGYSIQQEAGGIAVEVVFEEGHIHMGDNHIAITLLDSSGKDIQDARVKVEYGMSNMPNMPPMHYKARTRQMHGDYEAEINISMNGAWYLDIKILRPGHDVVNARFKFTVQDEAHESEHEHGHDH